MIRRPPRSTLFPCAALFRSGAGEASSRRAVLIGSGLALLAVVAAVVWLAIGRSRTASPSGGNQGRSIAVLPLVDVGGDSTQEYFADGMAEELANALGKVPGLR